MATKKLKLSRKPITRGKKNRRNVSMRRGINRGSRSSNKVRSTRIKTKPKRRRLTKKHSRRRYRTSVPPQQTNLGRQPSVEGVNLGNIDPNLSGQVEHLNLPFSSYIVDSIRDILYELERKVGLNNETYIVGVAYSPYLTFCNLCGEKTQFTNEYINRSGRYHIKMKTCSVCKKQNKTSPASDIQIGLTGTAHNNESFNSAFKREITEEAGLMCIPDFDDNWGDYVNPKGGRSYITKLLPIEAFQTAPPDYIEFVRGAEGKDTYLHKIGVIIYGTRDTILDRLNRDLINEIRPLTIKDGLSHIVLIPIRAALGKLKAVDNRKRR